MWGPISYVQAFEWLIQVLSRASGVPTVSTSNEMLKWRVMLWAVDPWELLSTADFIFFSPLLAFEVSFTSGMATEIMLVNDTSKVHLQPPHPHPPHPRLAQIKEHWMYHNTAEYKSSKIWMKFNFSQCLHLIPIAYQRGFLRGFLVPEAFWMCSTF